MPVRQAARSVASMASYAAGVIAIAIMTVNWATGGFLDTVAELSLATS
jgi:hypothetical protein